MKIRIRDRQNASRVARVSALLANDGNQQLRTTRVSVLVWTAWQLMRLSAASQGDETPSASRRVFIPAPSKRLLGSRLRRRNELDRRRPEGSPGFGSGGRATRSSGRPRLLLLCCSLVPLA